MLTGHDTDSDTILGLESGANDYVTKPFRINVLLARLRAHLRQHERSEDAVMTIGPYEFHPAGKMLIDKAGKKKIRLTDKEASILKYLFRAGDRPVARERQDDCHEHTIPRPSADDPRFALHRPEYADLEPLRAREPMVGRWRPLC